MKGPKSRLVSWGFLKNCLVCHCVALPCWVFVFSSPDPICAVAVVRTAPFENGESSIRSINYIQLSGPDAGMTMHSPYKYIYIYAERSGRLQLFHSRKACVSPHKKGFSSPRPLTHSERLKTATGFVQGGVPYTIPHAPQLVLNKACISTSRL